MPASILLYGPQGSGKTLISRHLARHFRLSQVIEEFDDRKPYPALGAVLIADALGNQSSSVKFTGPRLHVGEAMKLIRIESLAELIKRDSSHPVRGVVSMTQQQYVETTRRPLYSQR